MAVMMLMSIIIHDYSSLKMINVLSQLAATLISQLFYPGFFVSHTLFHRKAVSDIM